MNCYFCGCELNDQNRSMEHIVSNALGGKIKSNELLCKTCNNKMGEWENELFDTLFYFISSFNIKRDRGSIPTYERKTNNNQKVYIRPGFKIEEPVKFQKYDNKIKISAPNHEKAKEMLIKLKRKYPEIDIEKALSEAKTKREYVDYNINSDLSMNDNCRRTILKIILNFAFYQKITINKLTECIGYLKELNPKPLQMYLNKSLYFNDNDVISAVSIIGRKNDNKIIGYLQLFSWSKWYVVLNDCYKGENFEEHHVFFSDGEVNNVKFNNAFYDEKIYNTEYCNAESFSEELRRVLNKIVEMHNKRETHNIVERSFEETENELAEIKEFITDKEKCDILINNLLKNYIPFFIHNNKD